MFYLRAYRYWLILIALLIANIAVWTTAYTTGADRVEVSFLDVGQGDAVLIKAPGGKQMLIDAGRGRDILKELGREMPFHDRTIEVLVATHPDADHIGGFATMLENYDAEVVIRSGIERDTKVFEALEKGIVSKGVEEIVAKAGMSVRLTPQVSFLILSSSSETSDINDGSITGKLIYGDTSFLLTGDVSDEVERALVNAYGEHLQSDVLKVGHHGSDTSSDASFLARIAPAYTVISAGADNRYGHPHETVLTRLREIGARVFGTYEKGSITFVTDGRGMEVER